MQFLMEVLANAEGEWEEDGDMALPLPGNLVRPLLATYLMRFCQHSTAD